MASGTVKWFNTAKGFGFIQPDDGGADVFVHVSAVEQAGLRGLNEGDQVEFEGDLVAFVQAAKACLLDRRDVDEDVCAAIVGLNKAEALSGIEPLDRAARHSLPNRRDEVRAGVPLRRPTVNATAVLAM